ncbi:MAG: hypothetical protein ACLR4Z_06435 [Butyricicoccaceae bacterium]
MIPASACTHLEPFGAFVDIGRGRALADRHREPVRSRGIYPSALTG